MHKTYPGMLPPPPGEFTYTEGVQSGKASSPRLIGEGLSRLYLGLPYRIRAVQMPLTPKNATFSQLMCVSRKAPTTQCQSVFSTRSLNFLFVDRGIT